MFSLSLLPSAGAAFIQTLLKAPGSSNPLFPLQTQSPNSQSDLPGSFLPPTAMPSSDSTLPPTVTLTKNGETGEKLGFACQEWGAERPPVPEQLQATSCSTPDNFSSCNLSPGSDTLQPAVELQDLPFPSRLHSFQAFFLQPVSLANTSMPFSIHLQSASLCWATPKPGGCFYQAPPTFHAIRLSLSYPNLSEHRDKVCPPKL